MQKSHKKLLIFWLIAILFLLGWSFYWLRVHNNLGSISEKAQEIKAVYKMWDKLAQKDGQERSFLILFQNDMELRPGGGYMGSFGILKIKDGALVSFETHNTNVFDGRVPDGTPTPYPMPEMLRIKDWKMRDANWFPDWKDNAEKTASFYYAGQGQENFSGIMGINTQLLGTFLESTGPIKLENVPEEFTAQNSVLLLEQLVEQDYEEIGNSHGERKRVVYDLGMAILQKVKAMSYSDQLKLAEKLEEELKKKNIQLYFKDEELEKLAEENGWAGRVNTGWGNDYLMIIDANLGALKSDRLIKRGIDYTVDFSKDKPEAILKISYDHGGTQEDWMTKDYQGYLRVYVPKGSWFREGQEIGEVRFSEEYDKKVFGSIVKAPMGKTTNTEIRYTLPDSIRENDYNLLIQKQSGSGTVSTNVHIIGNDGTQKDYAFDLIKDYTLK